VNQPGNPLTLPAAPRQPMIVEEEHRVGLGERTRPRIIERHIVEALGQNMVQHRGLADLPRPGHQHHLELAHEVQQCGLSLPVHIHACPQSQQYQR